MNAPQNATLRRDGPAKTPAVDWRALMLVVVGALLLTSTAHAKKDPALIANLNVVVGASTTTLYIYDENFSDGVIEPIVTLGTDTMTVVAGMWTDQEIVAELAFPTASGDYLLAVTNHNDKIAPYDLKI